MHVRRDPIDEAARRAARQLAAVLEDSRAARISLGLSQRTVAAALGCSRQLIGAIERGKLDDIGAVQLARYCAALGLDVPLRAYPGGTVLRDAGQLRLIARLRSTIHSDWLVRAEVPVSAAPGDRRAIDLVLALADAPARVGVEAITRFSDSQAQTRAALLKQEALGLDVMVLCLADTRHNRTALAEGAPTVLPAFPLGTRDVLDHLRAGRVPPTNGVVFL